MSPGVAGRPHLSGGKGSFCKTNLLALPVTEWYGLSSLAPLFPIAGRQSLYFHYTGYGRKRVSKTVRSAAPKGRNRTAQGNQRIAKVTLSAWRQRGSCAGADPGRVRAPKFRRPQGFAPAPPSAIRT